MKLGLGKARDGSTDHCLAKEDWEVGAAYRILTGLPGLG